LELVYSYIILLVARSKMYCTGMLNPTTSPKKKKAPPDIDDENENENKNKNENQSLVLNTHTIAQRTSRPRSHSEDLEAVTCAAAPTTLNAMNALTAKQTTRPKSTCFFATYGLIAHIPNGRILEELLQPTPVRRIKP
jgi:hypothetical protein